ncbi:hypothetical protein [Streptomyces sp. NPDC056672]|uniref:hypothetical protein n=1 Tax=Streptomyces sp. NPDC056672 TaxID=3345906 RepID=UPI00368357F1
MDEEGVCALCHDENAHDTDAELCAAGIDPEASPVGWQGPRYWSHQRGRNGELPSTHRHPASEQFGAPAGCVGDAKVRELITAYQQ